MVVVSVQRMLPSRKPGARVGDVSRGMACISRGTLVGSILWLLGLAWGSLSVGFECARDIVACVILSLVGAWVGVRWSVSWILGRLADGVCQEVPFPVLASTLLIIGVFVTARPLEAPSIFGPQY